MDEPELEPLIVFARRIDACRELAPDVAAAELQQVIDSLLSTDLAGGSNRQQAVRIRVLEFAYSRRAHMLLSIHRATHSLESLDDAIACYRDALSHLPRGDSRTALVCDLGLALRSRSEVTDSVRDLEESIELLSNERLLMSSDAPNLPVLLSNLGAALMMRSYRTGRDQDLDSAVGVARESVELTDPESPRMLPRLNNLGSALHTKYALRQDRDSLTAAIDCHERALQGAAEQAATPDYYRTLSNLAFERISLWRLERDSQVLDGAIEAYREVASLVPAESPDYANLALGFSTALDERFLLTSDPEDLAESLLWHEATVARTPKQSHARASRIVDYANALVRVAVQDDDEAAARQALALYEEGLQLLKSRGLGLPLSYRIEQDIAWASASVGLSSVCVFLATGADADVRRELVLRAIEVSEEAKARVMSQHMYAQQLAGPEEVAATVMEKERGILQKLNEIDELELAAFGRVERNLDIAHLVDGVVLDEHDSGRDVAHRLVDALGRSPMRRIDERTRLVGELESVWSTIASASGRGAAYVASRTGSALVREEIERLEAEQDARCAFLGLQVDKSRTFASFARGGQGPRVFEVEITAQEWLDIDRRMRREVATFDPRIATQTWDAPLRRLWSAIGEGIHGLDCLAVSPSGPGHALPWHVIAERAGFGSGADGSPAIVQVPGLGSASARARSAESTGHALFVGNPRGDLPFAEREAAECAAVVGGTLLSGAEATRARVLERARGASVLHLATHARAVASSPLDSHIEVADGELLVREIAAHGIDADLVVVSACDSGRPGMTDVEQLLGLRYALLRSGVRRVLLSLWSVEDESTAALMREFHTRFAAGMDEATALAEAMAEVRCESAWSHPYYWGGFALAGSIPF